ncbi:alpha/beta hydrolase [Gordonia rubripertincta]|uniref:Alpha/beta hydrolase n=1 Tax=Gordonia rubripertincta TaxID=36822 RepID=A0ABT4MVQ0_GORRU|nr:alpha/beta hydrolase [Gordonia rubripertincta]MCZ4551084.1 alpha/beta hydrolase [Gordonia rubripertincta]
MASEQAAEFVDKLRQHGERMMAVSQLPLSDQRVVAEGLQAMTGTPDGVTFRDAEADGLAGIWVEADEGLNSATKKVVLYLHGGGYVYGTPVGYRNFAGHIARSSGVPVLIARYRRAPEDPFPAGLNDALAAYEGLLSSGYTSKQIALFGDSAGGGLVLSALLAMRDRGIDLPVAAVVMSPWSDLQATGDSMTTNADVDLLATAEGMRALGSMYAPGQEGDPIASPVNGDYSGLCPLFIQVGGHETLLDDSTRVRDKAVAAGVPVQFEVFPEMQHVFQLGAGTFPEADDAIAKASKYLREVFAEHEDAGQ